MTQHAEMLQLLPRARALAHAPVSGFRVGAVVEGGSGQLYLGANIELPGLPLGQTVHAEQAALANAFMAGERSVMSIAVTAAPCGHCRQFLQEFSADGGVRVLVQGSRAMPLAALLPHAFGPQDLRRKRGALGNRPKRLTLVEPSADALVLAALRAAERSYAPFSKAHSGVALQLKDRAIMAGSYIENAAFNPSLPPAQTALAVLCSLGYRPEQVVRAALVEIEWASIRQQASTQAALHGVALVTALASAS